MSQQRRRSISLSFLLISSVFLAAFTPIASADSRILLDLSNDHVVLIQGDSANVTLTIENNDTSIHDFTLSTDATSTSPAWNVTLVDQNISTVLPTFSVTTSIIVHLASDADLSDSGSIDIHVAHSGSNVASSITLYLSVAPSYLPAIEHTAVGDEGLISMEIGQSIDVVLVIEFECFCCVAVGTLTNHDVADNPKAANNGCQPGSPLLIGNGISLKFEQKNEPDPAEHIDRRCELCQVVGERGIRR